MHQHEIELLHRGSAIERCRTSPAAPPGVKETGDSRTSSYDSGDRRLIAKTSRCSRTLVIGLPPPSPKIQQIETIFLRAFALISSRNPS